MSAPRTRVAAIVLAGGAGSRMGSVDKPAQLVSGRTLLDSVLRALGPVADRIVVVGPHRPDLPASVAQLREDPPQSGPVAAIAAGFAALEPLDDDAIVLTAPADLPALSAVDVTTLARTLDESSSATPGVAVATDDDGRVQFLLAAWRPPALRKALGGRPAAGASVRSLLPPDPLLVALRSTDDVDTLADLQLARASTPWSLGAARALIREQTPLLPVRTIDVTPTRPPESIRGMVLAEPLIAASAHPPFHRSAMDGFAVAGPGPWTVLEPILTAGHGDPIVLAPGQAVRIATGAALPAGADRAVRDEYVERIGDALRYRPEAPVRDDTRRAGEDFAVGDELVPAGAPVNAATWSLARTAEVPRLRVRGPLRVRVVLTGDELRTDGPLRHGETRDALGPVIDTYVRQIGAESLGHNSIADQHGAFTSLLAERGDEDLLVVVGATGGGAADQLRLTLADLGAQVPISRVFAHPGGSQLFALLPDGRVLLGLPGNPFAAVATLLAMGPSIVAGATGATPREPWLADVTGLPARSAAKARLVPVRRTGARFTALPLPTTAHLGALAEADAIAVVPSGAVDTALSELFALP